LSDPTGTRALRRSFLAEGNRRLGRLRSQTHTILVEHDLMATRGDPLAELFGQPGQRLATFVQWFERAAEEHLGGGWWEKYLQRAYASGFVAGRELTGSPPRSVTLVPAVYRELAAREFAGIAAKMVQHVSRQAGEAAIGGRKPLPMYQKVLAVLRKVGQVGMKAAVNSTTVQLHNVARLAVFREAGVTRVGIDPERLEPPRVRRFRKHDHLRDASSEVELRRLRERLERQRAAAEERAAAAETRAERVRAALERQVAALVEGR
jgi:hypothetical protein